MKPQSDHYTPSVEDGYAVENLRAQRDDSEPKVYQCPRCCTSMEEDPSARHSVYRERDELVKVLVDAQAMRPFLLAQYGAVPACVLDFCNQARAAIARCKT